ncbi:MAG: DUF6460 domain-containing protein [Pseudomonadota bacterium]
MDRFFGGNPLGVLIKLVVISVVVGIVLAAFDLSPDRLFLMLQNLATRLYAMGFDAVLWAGQYFLLGAVVVIPIWLLSRLFAVAKPRSDD